MCIWFDSDYLTAQPLHNLCSVEKEQKSMKTRWWLLCSASNKDCSCFKLLNYRVTWEYCRLEGFKLLSDPWMVWCFYSSYVQQCTISASVGKGSGFYFSFAVGVCMLLWAFSVCECTDVCLCHSPSASYYCATSRKGSSDGWLSEVHPESCLECPFGIFLSVLVKIGGLFPAFTKILASHKHCCPCACQIIFKG